MLTYPWSKVFLTVSGESCLPSTEASWLLKNNFSSQTHLKQVHLQWTKTHKNAEVLNDHCWETLENQLILLKINKYRGNQTSVPTSRASPFTGLSNSRNILYIELAQVINKGRMIELECHHSVIPKRWMGSVIDHQWPPTSQNYDRQPDTTYRMPLDRRRHHHLRSGLVGRK